MFTAVIFSIRYYMTITFFDPAMLFNDIYIFWL